MRKRVEFMGVSPERCLGMEGANSWIVVRKGGVVGVIMGVADVGRERGVAGYLRAGGDYSIQG